MLIDSRSRPQELGTAASQHAGSALLGVWVNGGLHGSNEFANISRLTIIFLQFFPVSSAWAAGEVFKLLFDTNTFVSATAARTLVAFEAEGAQVLMDRREI